MSHKKSFKPLPQNVYLDDSDIDGLGVFAKDDIPKGYEFGITHVRDHRFPDGYLRTALGGFINHSTTPNCDFIKIDDTLELVVIKNIAKGEELTAKYKHLYTQQQIQNFK